MTSGRAPAAGGLAPLVRSAVVSSQFEVTGRLCADNNGWCPETRLQSGNGPRHILADRAETMNRHDSIAVRSRRCRGQPDPKGEYGVAAGLSVNSWGKTFEKRKPSSRECRRALAEIVMQH